MYCKQCSVKVSEEEYKYMGYCKECYERNEKDKIEEQDKKKEIKCPFCDSSNYNVANDNSTGGYLVGIVIAIILIFTGIISCIVFGIIILLSVAFSYVTIKTINNRTLIARCTRCNQTYKIKREELKK